MQCVKQHRSALFCVCSILLEAVITVSIESVETSMHNYFIFHGKEGHIPDLLSRCMRQFHIHIGSESEKDDCKDLFFDY